MGCERPRFTVCIPAYNRARHLATLLDSILDQDYKTSKCLSAKMPHRSGGKSQILSLPTRGVIPR